MHYHRWRRTGDPGPSESNYGTETCRVPECSQPHRAWGVCNKHYKQFSKDLDAYLAHLYIERGLTLQEIASRREVPIGKVGVRHRLVAYGVVMRQCGRKHLDVAVVRGMADAGMKPMQIATTLGCSNQAVHYHLNARP